MTTLANIIDAMMVSDSPADIGSLGRVEFWRSELGHIDLLAITEDHVEDSCLRLAKRGKLTAGRNITARPSGKPLAPATITRYLTTLAGIYRWAKRQRLLPRRHETPTKGLEKPTSPVDKNKYMTAEEVDKLIKAARATDQRWGRLPAMITLGFHTGLRLGSITGLRWKDIDWENQTAFVSKTKNGEPHIAPLSTACINELRKLHPKESERLIFEGQTGQPFRHTKLWEKTVALAGLEGRTFHWLRHSCGTVLAANPSFFTTLQPSSQFNRLTRSARTMLFPEWLPVHSGQVLCQGE